MGSSDAPTWWELIITVPTAAQEPATARLEALGWEECWVEQPLEHDKTPYGWEPRAADPDHVRIHVYAPGDADPAAEAQRLGDALAEWGAGVETAEVKAEDWLETWRRDRQVVPLRDGWSIAPPWLADDAPQPDRVVVIDPGLAFGAGDHPTTRDTATLLLEWLQPGDAVLDLGAGSGVLSILAVKAGAERAVAVEIDALACPEIDRNAALNGVGDRIAAIQEDATQASLDGPFDLVALNIGARQATTLLPLIETVTHPDSRVLVSGLAEWAVDAVIASYAESGWHLQRRIQKGSEWVTLGLRRE